MACSLALYGEMATDISLGTGGHMMAHGIWVEARWMIRRTKAKTLLAHPQPYRGGDCHNLFPTILISSLKMVTEDN